MLNKRGFTLLELIVVVVVLSILAGLALPPYMRTIEKGRSAEARSILGRIRSAEAMYYMENDKMSSSLPELSVNINADNACDTDYYFKYNVTGSGTTFTATATRCTSGGKSPQGSANYNLTMGTTGVIGGTAGWI